MLHINHTEPSCHIPGCQHTYIQSHRHSVMCSAGLNNTVWFEVYKNIFLSQNIPGQASLSLQTPLRSHFSSQLQTLNNSFSMCNWLPQGSNLEAELSKHKIYATWKKMKFYFLEWYWPLFTRQSHLISEFSWLRKRTSSKPVQAFAGLWRQTALQWADRKRK